MYFLSKLPVHLSIYLQKPFPFTAPLLPWRDLLNYITSDYLSSCPFSPLLSAYLLWRHDLRPCYNRHPYKCLVKACSQWMRQELLQAIQSTKLSSIIITNHPQRAPPALPLALPWPDGAPWWLLCQPKRIQMRLACVALAFDVKVIEFSYGGCHSQYLLPRIFNPQNSGATNVGYGVPPPRPNNQ